jgi:predicted RNA methylase
MISTLKEITKNLLAEPLNHFSARKAANDLYAFFVEVVNLENEAVTNNSHIETENGMAISTNAAAFCAIDYMRTRSFLLGIKKAIEDSLVINPNKPVELLYAGTGPFATLVIPLLPYFTPAQLQLVLLEINANTIGYLKNVIKKLGVENYIKTIVHCDACNYVFESDIQPDIILSETMKSGLFKEPQLMLMANLVKQCTQVPIMIPQIISVDVASINSTNKEKSFLNNLIKFDIETALELSNAVNNIPIFNEGVQIKISRNNKTAKDRISLLTTINTYEMYLLNYKESGLTLPCFMDKLNISDKDVMLLVKYNFGENPGFVFETTIKD